MPSDREIQLSPARRVAWLVEHWRLYRRELPMLLAFTAANAALVVVYPYVLKLIIDGLEAGRSGERQLMYVGVLIAVGIAHFFCYLVTQTMRTRLNLRFEYGVRLRAFEHTLRHGPGLFARFRTGDLVTRLNDDVNDKLSWFMCSGIFRVVEALAIIVFGLVMMLLVSPELTLYAAGPLPILIALFTFTSGRLHRHYDAVQQSVSQLNDSLESCFSGIRVVKAFTAESEMRRAVETAIENQRRAEVRAVRWQSVIDSLYGNIWQLGIIAVLLAGGAMAMDGRVTLGDIVAFDAYVLLLVWPMFDLGQFLVRGKLSAVCIDRIAEVEEMPPEVVERGDVLPAARRPDDPPVEDHAPAVARHSGVSVRFERVDYRYAGEQTPALAGIDFTVRPGGMTALAGEIGSGKSTILSLVPRIIDSTAGRLLIGERDARDWPSVELRRQIGFVSQEPLLLSGSVMENIRFGRAWLDHADIELAIDVAQLRGDLAEWRDGLETQVGSRGTALSGGQKQRVTLARALAGRPSVLLLDDCTASLDAQTESALWRQLIVAIPDCTILVVTHRPATLRRADQIVLLDRGRVCELGGFGELNRPHTRFHELYVRWKLWEDVAG